MRERTPVSDARPGASHVQALLDIVVNNLQFPFYTLDLCPIHTFDHLFAVEFVVEIPCEHQILPEFFEHAFEDLRLGDATLFGYPANTVGKLSGHTIDFAAIFRNERDHR